MHAIRTVCIYTTCTHVSTWVRMCFTICIQEYHMQHQVQCIFKYSTVAQECFSTIRQLFRERIAYLDIIQKWLNFNLINTHSNAIVTHNTDTTCSRCRTVMRHSQMVHLTQHSWMFYQLDNHTTISTSTQNSNLCEWHLCTNTKPPSHGHYQSSLSAFMDASICALSFSLRYFSLARRRTSYAHTYAHTDDLCQFRADLT